VRFFSSWFLLNNLKKLIKFYNKFLKQIKNKLDIFNNFIRIFLNSYYFLLEPSAAIEVDTTTGAAQLASLGSFLDFYLLILPASTTPIVAS
jgi:hypothetical protein